MSSAALRRKFLQLLINSTPYSLQLNFSVIFMESGYNFLKDNSPMEKIGNEKITGTHGRSIY